MAAESQRAGTSLSDPAKYKPDVLRHVERFNQAVQHFQKKGHNWPKSQFQNGWLTQLYTKESYASFETWILHTQKQYGGYNRMETLPDQA